MPRRILKWPLLILFWGVLIVLTLEGGLRLLAPSLPGQIGVAARLVMTGSEYDREWTPAWVQNQDHYYALRPGLENVLQYASPGVSLHLTTIELWEGGGIGFRNRPVDYFVDAVVVGDSFTFCFTEREDCWVSVLERETGMGLVNLGQPATGSRSHRLILEGFGAPLTPPLVIWQFFGNDFNDDYGLATWRGDIEPVESGDLSPIFAATRDPDAPLVEWLRSNSVAYAALEVALTGGRGGLTEADNLFEERYRAEYRDGVLAFGQSYEPVALDMDREANRIGLELSRGAFVEAQALVAGWDGQLVVVIIPTREEVYEHLTAAQMGADLGRLQSARLAMLDLCEGLALTCFDPLPGLQARAVLGEHLYYTDDMHLNPHGNAVVAELLADWLDSQGLLP